MKIWPIALQRLWSTLLSYAVAAASLSRSEMRCFSEPTMRISSYHAGNRRESGWSDSHRSEPAQLRSTVITTTLFMLSMFSLSSTVIAQNTSGYASLVAQAKADLNSGNAAKALEEAQQAEKIDPKPWEAYVVAGAAQELQKAYDAAVDSFTQALSNAPEAKKDAINDLLQKCIQKRSNDTSAGVLNIDYDKFADKTAVSLELRSVSTLISQISFSSGPFGGQHPLSLPSVTMYFDIVCSSALDQYDSTHCFNYHFPVTILADSSRSRWLTDGPGSHCFPVPIWLLERLAMAKSAEGEAGTEVFTITAADQDFIRRYLDAILPSWYIPEEVDQARARHLTPQETVNYINQLLSNEPATRALNTKMELRGQDELVLTESLGTFSAHAQNLDPNRMLWPQLGLAGLGCYSARYGATANCVNAGPLQVNSFYVQHLTTDFSEKFPLVFYNALSYLVSSLQDSLHLDVKAID
jgi:tetratricopeptide (TPR) repeat protein